MAKILYYDLTGNSWVDSTSFKPLQRSELPAQGYQQLVDYEIHCGHVDPYFNFAAQDLSEVQALNAAIDTDFASASPPLARTNDPANYDLTQKAAGIITVAMDSDTVGFRDAVDGQDQLAGYFEIRLFDSGGECPHTIRQPGQSITLLGLVDPGTGDPGTTPTNYYTKAENDAMDMKKATYDPTDVGCDAFDRANHHGTQSSATISDFAAGVSANADVSANTTHRGQTTNPHAVTKAQVGLGNVDNTADADKPVSTAQQAELDAKEDTANKGTANGYAELDATGKVPSAQLPAYVDDVEEYASLAAFPVAGDSGKIYIAIDTNLTYRWSGSTYVTIASDLALGETSTTAYRGDRGQIAYEHSQLSGNPHGVDKDNIDVMVGDSGSGGTKGLVPAPGAGDAADDKYLKADGTWEAPVSNSDDFIREFSSSAIDLTSTASTTTYTVPTGKVLYVDKCELIIEGVSAYVSMPEVSFGISTDTDLLVPSSLVDVLAVQYKRMVFDVASNGISAGTAVTFTVDVAGSATTLTAYVGIVGYLRDA